MRYSPNSSVVPYFPENLTLYLINIHFPKHSQNRVLYRHPFSEMRIFTVFPRYYTEVRGETKSFCEKILTVIRKHIQTFRFEVKLRLRIQVRFRLRFRFKVRFMVGV